MSALNNSALMGASGSTGYQISRSVRLRSSASAYFNRTPASAGNRKTWTWSGWVKRGGLPTSGYYSLFGADSGAGASFYAAFDNSTQQLEIGQGATVYRKTTQVFRDPSAFYHIVAVLDTTLATAADRWKVYVNGVQVTAFGTTNNPTQNSDLAWNNNVAHTVGADIPNTGARNYFDGYLTEVNFIDGQALTPASFGETNAVTGVWQPKKYTGTYGTNGFYLNFSDNSSNTATTIGKDYSGNGNNWTPNNISVTAGATYDSMLDVPTQWADGGNGRGNYATLNPLILNAVASMGVAGGNLNITRSSAGWASLSSTIRISSGKWYWEVLPTNNSTSQMHGIQTIEALGQYPGQVATSWGYYTSNGQKYNNGTGAAYGSAYSPSNPIGVALDMDNGRIWFSRNGVWEASGDPAAGTNAAFTGITGEVVPAFGLDAASTAASVNFGQRPFAYTPPSGFKALNTLNLPTPTILKGNQYMDVSLYTGTGSALSVTNSGSMQPDFVWIKGRSSAYEHALFDSVRGARNLLRSNATAAEVLESAGTSLTSFDSSGFSLGTNGATASTNVNGQTFVGWQWKEGATQGFDIVTLTAQASGSATFAHSLGVAPKLIITKQRATSGTAWTTYHASVGNTGYLVLNTTAAAATLSTVWNNTSPTSTEFTLGSAFAGAGTMVAYLFAEVAGFSRFGSYTGNGSTDGPFVFLGFRPKFVMWKNASSAQSWLIEDAVRSPYNQVGLELYPNLSSAEDSGSARSPTQHFDFLSNGFKVRGAQEQSNQNGNTIIYAAFAENPFKNALAR